MWKPLSLAVCLGLSSISAHAYTIKNENKQAVAQVKASQFFSRAGAFQSVPDIDTDVQKLKQVAAETLHFLNTQHDPEAIQPGLLSDLGVNLADVKRTLEKIIDTVNEDTLAKRPSRLHNPTFLAQNFQLFRWSADKSGSLKHKVQPGKNGQIRVTKYVVFEANGAPQQDPQHCCALYEIPQDEATLTPEAAEAKKDQLIRYKYTKQQVVAGALKGLGVNPLVWLSRQGLEDALMQGSIMVKMSDGRSRMFNVHRNNGIGYDRRIKNPRNQRRYWYFKEVKGIQGYGTSDKITVQPGVTFAGDVYNLGLGKLVGIEYKMGQKSMLKLGVLADTGGAFIPNLYQLDFLAGVYPNRQAYKQGVSHLPTYATAYILIAK